MQLDFSDVLFPQYAGLVYALRTVPEIAPLRLKIGWSTNFKRRLEIHRVTNPTLEVLWTGPCVTQLGERQEVLEVVQAALDRRVEIRQAVGRVRFISPLRIVPAEEC